jgi:hypothetical protein
MRVGRVFTGDAGFESRMLSEQHLAHYQVSNLPLKPKEKDYFKKDDPEFLVNVKKGFR